MNNYPRYPPPASNFSPYNQRPQTPNNQFLHETHRLPDYRDQELHRRDGLRNYPNFSEKESSSAYASPMPNRRIFSNEDSGSYRQISSQFRHRSGDILYRGAGLSPIDQRTLLQSAITRNLQSDSLAGRNRSYSDADNSEVRTRPYLNITKNDSLVGTNRSYLSEDNIDISQSFHNSVANEPTHESKSYSNFTNSALSRENISQDIQYSSARFSRMQNLSSNSSPFLDQQNFPNSRQDFNRIASSPVYSKNISQPEHEILNHERSFPCNSSSEPNMLYSNIPSPKAEQQSLNDDIMQQVKDIQEMLEQQKRCRDLDIQLSLASKNLNSPVPMYVESNSSEISNTTLTLFSNPSASSEVFQHGNTLDLERQTKMPDKSGIFPTDESVEPSVSKSNMNDGMPYSSPLSSLSHAKYEDYDRNAPNFDAEVYSPVAKNVFEIPGKSELIQVLSAAKLPNPDNSIIKEVSLASSNHETICQAEMLGSTMQIPNVGFNASPRKEPKISNTVKSFVVDESKLSSPKKEQKVNKPVKSSLTDENNDLPDFSVKSPVTSGTITNAVSAATVPPLLETFDENVSSTEWSKSDSIPFLSETTDPGPVSLQTEFKLKTDIQLQESQPTATPTFKTALAKSGETTMSGSTLEHALATLAVNVPVVGLDFIIEDKNSVTVEGRFPFRCKLCNCSIARTLILDHILGSKHRLKFLKIKDEAAYDNIMRQKDPNIDKEAQICEAAGRMESLYGRGRVVVSLESPSKGAKKMPVMNLGKINHDLMDIDFEPSCKPDVKTEKTITETKRKIEDGLFAVCENDASLNSVTSVNSNSLLEQSLDKENKELEIVSFKNITSLNFGVIKSEKPAIGKNSVEGSAFGESTDQQDKEDSSSIAVESNRSVHCPSPQESPATNFCGLVAGVKRSASPLDNRVNKALKKDHGEAESVALCISDDLSSETSLHTQSRAVSETTEDADINVFNPAVLEQLSKCNISSDNEADILLQTVDVLLKLLLRYKLKNVTNVDVEKLTCSLHDKPSEELYKILDFVNSSKPPGDQNISYIAAQGITEKETTNSTLLKNEMKDPEFNKLHNSRTISENNILQNNQPKCISNTNAKISYETTLNSSSTVRVSNVETKVVNSIHGIPQNNIMVSSASQSEMGVSSTIFSNSSVTTPKVTVSQPSNAQWLQPPPFFPWPNSSTTTTSTAPSLASTTQTGQIWSSPYHSNMAFYQQHGYSSPSLYHPYGVTMVPSVAMQLTQPPPPLPPVPAPMAPVLPPPLPQQSAPPLPPVPSNSGETSVPPLPPLPNDPPLQISMKPPPPPTGAYPKMQ